MFTSIKNWLNGKKTIIGLVITAVSTLVLYLPAILPFFGVEAVHITQVVGVVTTVIGVAHKIYKWLYGEDVPPTPPVV